MSRSTPARMEGCTTFTATLPPPPHPRHPLAPLQSALYGSCLPTRSQQPPTVHLRHAPAAHHPGVKLEQPPPARAQLAVQCRLGHLDGVRPRGGLEQRHLRAEPAGEEVRAHGRPLRELDEGRAR